MAEENPFEQETVTALVTQLQDLVKMAIDAKDREIKEGVSFQELHQKVQMLKSLMDDLQTAFDAAKEKSSYSEQDLAELQKQVASLPPTQKKLYDTLQNLKEQCEAARGEMFESLQQNSATLKQVEESLKTDKEKKNLRKGKFKGVGGKKGWLPS